MAMNGWAVISSWVVKKLAQEKVDDKDKEGNADMKKWTEGGGGGG